MSKSVHYQRVKEHLEALKLHTALSELDPLLEAAGRDEQTPVEVLDLE